MRLGLQIPDFTWPDGPARLGPYWPGWDIARGVAFVADGTGGFVADGWGGLHGFDLPGFSGDTVPGPPAGTPYWPGWKRLSMAIAITEDHQALARTAAEFLQKREARRAARELLEAVNQRLRVQIADRANADFRSLSH